MRALLAFMFIALVGLPAMGYDVQLTWTPPVAEDLDRYHIYMSTTVIECVGGAVPPALTPHAVVPSAEAPPHVVTGLSEGRYYFVVTALDESSNESLCSNVAAIQLDSTPPEPIGDLEVEKFVVFVGSSVSVTGGGE